MVEAVVHQDGDLVLVLQEQDVLAVAARRRAEQAKALRARRQDGLSGSLFDEPIVQRPAHLAEAAVVSKQRGSDRSCSFPHQYGRAEIVPGYPSQS